MNEVIYIPIAVEKELPEVGKKVIWMFEDKVDSVEGSIEESEGRFWVKLPMWEESFSVYDFTHWLKPVLISDLITAVQNSIAPQRQDLHTIIEESINSFFK